MSSLKVFGGENPRSLASLRARGAETLGSGTVAIEGVSGRGYVGDGKGGDTNLGLYGYPYKGGEREGRELGLVESGCKSPCCPLCLVALKLPDEGG